MKEIHRSFPLPDNLDSKVWRYIDFTKYVSLLSTSSLFFVRADKLEDKFEGAATKWEIQVREEMKTRIGQSDHFFGMQALMNKYQRKSVGISSWHLSEHESTALWKIYPRANEGVVIQSTFKKLADSFDNYTKDLIYTGLVHYKDYDAEQIPDGNLFNKFMHKRNSFDFENEVRAIFFRFPPSKTGEAKFLNEENIEEHYTQLKGTGELIEVDINAMIENVVISPFAGAWFIDLVKEVNNVFNFDATVNKSMLTVEPFF